MEIPIEQPVKPKKVILIVDISGSTGSSSFYYNSTGDILNAAIEEYGAENVSVVLWDTSVIPSDIAGLRKQIAHRRGGGGTSPSVFASTMFMPEGCRAIIITDGQVSSSEVSRCDKIINERHFESVHVYFISTGGRMNLSVSMPFTRNCEDIRIFVQEGGETQKTLLQGSTTAVIDLEKYHENPQLFLAEVEQIRGTIILKNVGRGLNIPLRDAILLLQKHLMRIISIEASKGAGWEQLRKTVSSGSYQQAVQECREIINGADTTVGKQVEAAIADLIKQCSGSNDFSFENLEPGRLRRADVQAVPAVEELPPQQVVHKFECPVSFSDANITLLIHQGPPVLDGVDPKFIESLMTNPLLLLTNPELVAKLQARFGHSLGCATFVELWKRGNPLSPFTRDPISCALIPLVPDSAAERTQYAKANSFALANLFFGNKLAGDTGLWLGVVYKALLLLPRLVEDKELVAAFQQFVTKFWCAHTTNLTLSGLPIAPMIKAPMDIAIWFCVASPDIMLYQGENGKAIQAEDDATNRLRTFGSTAEYLVQFLDLLDYCYDREWTVDRLRLYKAFGWMMFQSKDPNSDWRIRIRAQWQNFHEFQSGTVVLLDGPSNAPLALPAQLQDLPLGTIVALMQLVDKSKKTNSVMIPRILELVDIPKAVINYGYPKMPEEWIRAPIPVCQETLRPFVIDRRDHKEWKVRSEAMFGPLDKQIHNYNYFIQFVFEKNRYPDSEEEFILYTLAKQSGREVNPVDTLPMYQLEFVHGLFTDYTAVLGPKFANVPVVEFKRITWESMREADRAKIDGSDKF
jgi:hypothetical protein